MKKEKLEISKKAFSCVIENEGNIYKLIPIAIEHNITFNEVKKMLYSYVKRLSLNESADFIEKKKKFFNFFGGEKEELKKFYLIVIKNQLNPKIISEFIEKEFKGALSTQDVFKLCDLYLEKYATKSEKKRYQADKFERSGNKSKYNVGLEKRKKAKYMDIIPEFIDLDDDELYFYALEHGHSRYVYIKDKVDSFLDIQSQANELNNINRKKINIEIERKLDTLYEFLLKNKENRREAKSKNRYNAKLKEALVFARKIINLGDKELNNSLEDGSLTLDEIDSKINLLKEDFPDIYIKVYNRMDLIQKNTVDDKIEIIIPFVKRLTKERLDIVDFYLETNLDLKEAVALCKASKKVGNREKGAFNKFFHRYCDNNHLLSEQELEQLYLTKTEIDTKKDKNGVPIPGTGRFIEDDEISMLLSYLEKNNIPITKSTYRAIFVKYINKNIDFEEHKKR